MLDRVCMTEPTPPGPPASRPATAPDPRPEGRATAAPETARPDSAARRMPRRAGRGRSATLGGIAAAGLWAGLTGAAHRDDPATWIFGAVAVAGVVALIWVTTPGPQPRPEPSAKPKSASSGRARDGSDDGAPDDGSDGRARLSPPGLLMLAGWFAVQALRGAVDVAGRALGPADRVAPGWYRHPLDLPPGAPQLVMANAITMLPGTLTAELHPAPAPLPTPEDPTPGNPTRRTPAPQAAPLRPADPAWADPASEDRAAGRALGAPPLAAASAAGEAPQDARAVLVIHLLDARQDPAPDLAALEARVRAAFGLAPAGPRPPLPAAPPAPDAPAPETSPDPETRR